MKEKKEVTYPLVVQIEAVLMENKEVIHFGKSLGFINKKQSELVEAGATKLSRPSVVMIALNNNVA